MIKTLFGMVSLRFAAFFLLFSPVLIFGQKNGVAPAIFKIVYDQSYETLVILWQTRWKQGRNCGLKPKTMKFEILLHGKDILDFSTLRIGKCDI